MKNRDELANFLDATFADHKLDRDERYDLQQMGPNLSLEDIRFLRNRAFALARDDLNTRSLKWLEQVIKTLENSYMNDNRPSSGYFAPSTRCRDTIVDLLGKARSTVDICVFTISDNVLRDAILRTYKRGVAIRLISDNDKVYDRGSDVRDLAEAGIPTRCDSTPNHMHHKFAIVDGSCLINGSFNWTRSATTFNNENIVVSYEASLLEQFNAAFDALWDEFG